MRVKISVVIPTWNRLHLLPRALDSVFAQSFSPLEVIVVDDGSTDLTAEWISENYPAVKLVEQEHSGVSAGRNSGIRHAKGDWIALLDSDDEWLPKKLERQVALVSSRPDARVCHTEEIWIRNGKRVNAMNKHKKPQGWIYQQCLPLCCVSPSSVLLHKYVFEKVGLFDEGFPACEDYELWLRVFNRFEAFLVDEPLLVKYGGHDDQLSKAHWGMDRFRVRALDRMLESGQLSQKDRMNSIAVLLKKCRILSDGADKRDKMEEAKQYRALMNKYQQEVGSC